MKKKKTNPELTKGYFIGVDGGETKMVAKIKPVISAAKSVIGEINF